MAIYGFSGKPGAGKSYSAVDYMIIPALKAGRTIYHNMLLKEPQLRVIADATDGRGKLIYFDPECTADELVDGAPVGALVVIDESVRYWPSGTKANKVPANQLEFFTKHRHRVGQGADAVEGDIVVICQDFGSQCAAFIRELVQMTYYSVKLDFFGLPSRYRLEIYDGVVKGDQPSQKRLIRKEVRKYRKEVYACYVSHTQSLTGVAGEKVYRSNLTVWRNWKVYLAAFSIFVGLPLALWALSHNVNRFRHQVGGKAAAEHSEAAPAADPSKPKPQAEPAPRPPPQDSAVWKLVGWIDTDNSASGGLNLRRFVLWSLGGSRLVPRSACKADDALNFVCQVDGAIVAVWTGPHVTELQQNFMTPEAAARVTSQ